jgi:D-alanyl-D-alanine carboxypeptidase (penicillin-binding protein 5/6)
LLNYGFRYFETHQLYRADEVLKTTRIWYGDQEQVSLGVGKDIFITIPRGRYRDLDASMEIDSEVSAPIGRGQSLGQLNIKLDDDMILSESIVAMQAVNEGSLIDQAMDKIKLLFR